MNCSYCSKKAHFKCECSAPLMCQNHFTNHISDNRDHNYENVDNIKVMIEYFQPILWSSTRGWSSINNCYRDIKHLSITHDQKYLFVYWGYSGISIWDLETKKFVKFWSTSDKNSIDREFKVWALRYPECIFNDWTFKISRF